MTCRIRRKTMSPPGPPGMKACSHKAVMGDLKPPSPRDTMEGGHGADELDGGGGADYLDGGDYGTHDGAVDLLHGGSGGDLFVNYMDWIIPEDCIDDYDSSEGDSIFWYYY